MTHKTNRNERHVSMYMLTSSRFVFDRALISTVSFPGNRTRNLPRVFTTTRTTPARSPLLPLTRYDSFVCFRLAVTR